MNSTSNTWAEYKWPEWVPVEQRKQIEEFWCESWGRSPKTWLEDVKNQRAPQNGQEVMAYFEREKGIGHVGGAKKGKPKLGRYLHAWNNMGRLVYPDGTYDVVSVQGEDFKKDE